MIRAVEAAAQGPERDDPPGADAAARIDGAGIARRAGLEPSRVEVVDRIGSTNQELMARPMHDEPGEPTVLVALRQVAGRGRRGRVWRSDARDSLTMSVSVERRLVPGAPALGGLSIALAVGIARAASALAADVALKWPNDLQRGGRKVAGMLVETRRHGEVERVVAGIGTNLRLPVQVAAHLDQPAAGLLDDAGAHPPSREVVAAAFARALLDAFERFFAHGFADTASRWRQYDALAGREVSVTEDGRELLYGVAQGIDGTGALLVLTAHGPVPVAVGDVSVRARPGAPAAQARGST